MSFPVRHITQQSVPRSDELDIPEADSCISNSCELQPDRFHYQYPVANPFLFLYNPVIDTTRNLLHKLIT